MTKVYLYIFYKKIILKMTFGKSNIFTMGIRRSGNHAIAQWLMPQINEKLIYFNDFDFSQINSEKLLDIRKISYIEGDNETLKYDLKKDNNVPILYGLENQSINDFFNKYKKWEDIFNNILESKQQEPISNDNTYINIIRNPWNNVASELQWFYNRGNFNVELDKLYELWDEYYDNWNNKNNNITTIIYDKWFISEDYRKEISKKLNINFTDKNLNKIHQTGNGSSFTKQLYNGLAQKMNVLRRYDEIKNFPDMQIFLNSTKSKELADKWNNLCTVEKIEKLIINV